MARKTALDFVRAPRWPQLWILAGDRIEVIGRFHFIVESHEFPGEWHCIDLEPVDEQGGGCTCTSYRTRGTCRHVRKIRAHIGLDE